MINILTIIGARPQIIKASAISRAIRNNYSTQIREVLVHTGQHYDNNMSQVFFDEMQIPAPQWTLNIGSSTHGDQTARMIAGIEMVCQKEQPDYVVLYGDTNSTLAGAIAASKLHIPIAHVEAGLRSFNKKMPEEINRILSDHTSSFLFCPTQTAVSNLVREGFATDTKAPYHADNPGVFHCGDVMYDNHLYFSALAQQNSKILKQLQIRNEDYVLLTLHRDANTDDAERLSAIFSAIFEIAEQQKIKIVIPLHPRTAKMLPKNLKPKLLATVKGSQQIKIIEPVSFLDMLMLEQQATMIITDSGGVQKEAYFCGKPCIILRPQTEWVEIVEQGCAVLADADPHKMKESWQYFTKTGLKLNYPPIFGNGKAADFICETIINNE